MKRKDTGAGSGLCFSSETLLQQAIAGLLARMPEVWGVQILQGAQEYGKDIVFYMRGAFAEILPCACVVKNHSISGRVDSSRGARSVFLQTQQAFDTPFFDGAGGSVFIQRVYVISPDAIPQATMSSIAGRMKERSGQVVFISGRQLFELFKKFWPNFIVEEASAIEKHLSATAITLADNPLSSVVSLYNLGTVDKSPESLYVQQDFLRRFANLQVLQASTAFLPLPRSLSGRWNRAEIKKARQELKTISQYLTLAGHWSLAQGPSLTSALEQLSDTLEASFGEGLRRMYKPTRPEVPNVGPDAAVTLADWPNVARTVQALGKQLDEALEPLYTEERLYNEFLREVPDRFLDLSSSAFTRACTLSDFFQVAPGLFAMDRIVKAVLVPKEAVEKWKGPLLIVGAAGFGKTSFCRWHALNDAQLFRTGQSEIVPVYVPLHKLARIDCTDFDQTFLSNVGESSLLPKGELARPHNLRLYVDGLDEISDQNQARRVVELLRDGLRDKRVDQSIITSRDYIYGPWLSWMPRLQLKGFDEPQLRELVEGWIPRDSPDNARFFQELKRSRSLWPLTRTPLLATLIILVFRQTQRLPENEVRLYDTFIDLLSEGWNLAKRILKTSKFGPQIKKTVLRTLAERTHEKRKKQFAWADVKASIESHIKSDAGVVRDLCEELVQDGIIIRSGSIYEFAHLSFQEYLTAKEYNGDPKQTGIRSALRTYLRGDDWPRQVLRFYFGLSGNPRALSGWLWDQHTRFEKSERENSEEMGSSYDRVDELDTVIKELYNDGGLDTWKGLLRRPGSPQG